MFESVMELTQEQVQWLDECSEGTWTLNPQTGLVDVEGSFNCSGQRLKGFKGVKFGVVTGYFWCDNNLLISLEGAPQTVSWGFYCRDNQLTSLVGAPLKVGDDFVCNNNKLISLDGAPQDVGGTFVCNDNALTSLEGAPREVGAGFYCRNNSLTSLMGAPLKVRGYFSCDDNPVSRDILKTIFAEMQQGTSYLAAVESLWSEIPQDDQALLYADDFKWVTPEQSKGLLALRSYHDLRGML